MRAAMAETASNADARAAAGRFGAPRRVRQRFDEPRMGEANVFSIVSGVAALASSLPRRAVGDAATEEALKALVDGPRARRRSTQRSSRRSSPGSPARSARRRARASAPRSRGSWTRARGLRRKGLATGQDRFANHRTRLRTRKHAKKSAEVNARAAAQLVAVLAAPFVCGLFPSDVVWGFLTDATARLSELDATLTLGVLRVAGPRTRPRTRSA